MYQYLLSLFLLVPFITTAQGNTKHLQPKMGKMLTFDASAESILARRDKLLFAKNRTTAEERELSKLLDKYPEVVESIWECVDGGCSWYCGGGPYKITASSSLVSEKVVNYKADNIHDLSYRTVWSEGVVGYGIGEYVEYHFKAESPRITQIQIANGYVKSDKTWFENSRVKELKMYVNGKPYAILDLKDSKALQQFDIPVLGRNNGKKDWILRFEIADVYKGDKFDDTVLSEIFFDGTDVH